MLLLKEALLLLLLKEVLLLLLLLQPTQILLVLHFGDNAEDRPGLDQNAARQDQNAILKMHGILSVFLQQCEWLPFNSIVACRFK
jgi:hypothetical protein